jgi:hypothetical protein
MGHDRKVLRRSSQTDQLHHLPPELRRMGHPESRHLEHLRLKPRGVHETGATSTFTELSGDGDGEPQPDGTLSGEIRFDHGDDTPFIARRWPFAAAC